MGDSLLRLDLTFKIVSLCHIIVPLVKYKTGDLSDVDNYRAITLSNYFQDY